MTINIFFLKPKGREDITSPDTAILTDFTNSPVHRCFLLWDFNPIFSIPSKQLLI